MSEDRPDGGVVARRSGLTCAFRCRHLAEEPTHDGSRLPRARPALRRLPAAESAISPEPAVPAERLPAPGARRLPPPPAPRVPPPPTPRVTPPPPPRLS